MWQMLAAVTPVATHLLIVLFFVLCNSIILRRYLAGALLNQCLDDSVNGSALPVECGFVNNHYCESIAKQDTSRIDRICDPNSGVVHGRPSDSRGRRSCGRLNPAWPAVYASWAQRTRLPATSSCYEWSWCVCVPRAFCRHIPRSTLSQRQ